MMGLDPSAWMLINQANQVKPDQAQALEPGQIPPMLQSNEVYNQAPKPQAPVAPQPAAAASGVGAYLKQTPQVKPKAEPRADRSMQEARINPFQAAYLQSLNDQAAAIDDAQNNIRQVGSQPVGVDWTPVAAYLDSVVPGSKLTQAALATRGMSQEDKNKMLLGLQQDLTKQKAGFAQQNLQSLTQQQNFERLISADEERARHNHAEEMNQMNRADGMGGRVGVMQDSLIGKAVKEVNDDKALNNYRPRIDGADRILGQLAAARSGKMVDTSQLLNDINTEYVNLLTGANNSALGKQERTEYATAASKYAAAKQILTANPESIHSPEILRQIETGVKDLRNNYAGLVGGRLNKLHVEYPHTPEATRQRDQAIADTRAQYATPLSEESFDEDVIRYAKAHGISNDEAQRIKIQRTGGR